MHFISSTFKNKSIVYKRNFDNFDKMIEIKWNKLYLFHLEAFSLYDFKKLLLLCEINIKIVLESILLGRCVYGKSIYSLSRGDSLLFLSHAYIFLEQQ